MSSEYYILEAYKLNYRFREGKVYAVTVPQIALQRLLNYLFNYEVIHSKPVKRHGETLYNVYIYGDEKVARDVKEHVNELKSELEINADFKYTGSIDSLDENIKSSMAYKAIRQYLCKRLGFRRGSGQKLYDTSVSMGNYEVLDVYQSYVTGHDTINNTSYVFIDAARKLEFTKTLKELEAKYEQETISKIKWVKIRNSTVSFYIEPNIKPRDSNYPEDRIYETLRYIVDTRFIPLDINKIDINLDDAVALVPKSVKLLDELRRRGYVGITNKDGEAREVIFLPKNALLPVASMDSVFTLLRSPIDLKIAPTKRHEEIESLVAKLGLDIDLEGITFSLDSQPLRIEAQRIPLSELYINLKTSPRQDLPSLALGWNPFEKIRRIAGKLTIYILYDKNDDNSSKIADLIHIEVSSLGAKIQQLEVELRNPDDLKSHVNYITKRTKGSNCVVLVVGPSNVDAEEDRDLRDFVEREFRFKGLFCWYISITPRHRKSESSSHERNNYTSIAKTIPYKLRVIMKELAIRLGIFSHELQPLELLRVDGGRDVFDVVSAVDTTIIGLERGQLRIGYILMLMNVNTGKCVIKTDVTPPSMREEDYVLAETIKKALREDEANNGKLIVYVNRAKLEALFEYFQGDEIKELLDRAVLIGATKTHTYPRILKVRDNEYVNPELTVYQHLYTVDLREYKNMKAKLSRYLAITTMATRGMEGLTVKPTLLSIVLNNENWKLENLNRILNYTLTLCILNNTSTWIHSLPWPLHRVDRILKTAHRLAENTQDIIKALGSKDIVKTL